MTPAEFELRVQHLLDVRRDPLADRQCVEHLADHPDSIEFVERLLVRCAALPAVARLLQSRATVRRGPWLVLAVGVAVACIIWVAVSRGGVCAVSARPLGRVLSASLAPILPRLQAVPTSRVRSVLIDEPRVEFEVFTQWCPR